MYLCLDLGNTSGKVRIDFPEVPPLYYRPLTDEEIIMLIVQYQPSHIIYCDVRGTASDLIAQANTSAHVIPFTYQLPLPIKNSYQTPHTLGMDRLAAALGAWQHFPYQSSLIIDAGTCITYDFITSEGEFLGGLISPGLQMRCKAMHTQTAKLPLVEIKPSQSIPFVGRTTQEGLQSGVFHGLCAEIEGIIKRYSDIFGQFNIVLTGGDALFFEKTIKEINFVNENLVLDGLKAALDFNLTNKF
ncbi:MAG: type III pantothenate kinase [Cytophagales bacterium]|nr:type III pantothenate kinase [Bernardetiaceae bacterium]MDW8210782.1 type III pantothenate kinase [Cytophagales bacterium]